MQFYRSTLDALCQCVSSIIYDRLASHFGEASVFIDVDSIPIGVDFTEYLDQQVSQCQLLIAVIGRQWLAMTDNEGNRRLDNPTDFVRIELESALNRKIPIVPLLISPAQMPTQAELPTSLQKLVYRNGIPVRAGADFNRDMDRLIAGIEAHFKPPKPTKTVPTPTPLSSAPPPRPQPRSPHQKPRSAHSMLSVLQNRRGFLTFLGLGGSGLVSVLLWEAIQNQSSPPSAPPSPRSTSAGSPKVLPTVSDPEETQPPVSSPKVADDLSLQTFNFEVITVDSQGQRQAPRSAQAQFFTEDLGDGIVLEMVAIPGGRFTMGSPDSEQGRLEREGPQHLVTVSDFYLGKYEVTQAQWRVVASWPQVDRRLAPDSAHFEGDNRPVEKVSWEEAIEFCARLAQRTGRDYRLPSEAEWEYACRAGTTTPFHFGETITADLANYDATETYGAGPKGEYRGQTTDVGSFSANAYGLYDMHGNVWEWCQDHWHGNYDGAPTDGSAWIDASDNDNHSRILRGGSWFYNPGVCRAAYCNDNYPRYRNDDHGLRLSCSLPRTP